MKAPFLPLHRAAAADGWPRGHTSKSPWFLGARRMAEGMLSGVAVVQGTGHNLSGCGLWPNNQPYVPHRMSLHSLSLSSPDAR